MPLALPLDPLAALTFIGLLVTLLTFHEAGHALVARGYGVALLEFGLGILPRLVGVARACGRWHVVWGPRADLEAIQDATLLSLNLIPLGAFVRLVGEDDTARPGGLASAPPLGRALVFGAGPLANLILAFTILTVGFHAGWPDVVSVDSIAPGRPAAVAGQSIRYPLQLSRLAAAHPGEAPPLTVTRPGQTSPWQGPSSRARPPTPRPAT
jgi:regulator of sigma E protease